MIQEMTLTVHAENLLTSNKRPHRMVKARIVKTLRHAAAINVAAQGIKPVTRAHVTVTIAWPDRRRRDRLNIADTVKALIDGMTDAGVWPDDNDQHLLGPDFRTSPELSGIKGVTRLTFTIQEAPEMDGPMVRSPHNNKAAPGGASTPNSEGLTPDRRG